MSARARRARLLVAAGYVALFAVAFYVTLVVVFPVEAVRRALAAAVERESDLDLVVDELTVGWDGDLHARGVAVTWAGPGRSVPLFVADAVQFDVAAWSLVWRRLEAGFNGAAYDGRFEGRVEGPLGGAAERVSLRITRLDLARHAGLRALTTAVVAGRLSGDLVLRLAAGDDGRSANAGPAGAVHLSLAEASVRELPLVGSSLPAVTIESGTASGILEAGRLEVRTLEIKGPEVSLSGSGQIVLRTPAAASTISGTLRLRPETRLPPTLRRLIAGVARTPDATGAYGFLLLGTVVAPEVRPL